MKNFLAFLAALVLVVGAVGWYLGWYQVSWMPLTGGHKRVSVDIDTQKVKDDVTKGGEKVLEKGKEAIGTFKDKSAPETGKKMVNDPLLGGLKMPVGEEESSDQRR